MDFFHIQHLLLNYRLNSYQNYNHIIFTIRSENVHISALIHDLTVALYHSVHLYLRVEEVGLKINRQTLTYYRPHYL